MDQDLLFIGPVSPPDNGPGLKNKLLLEELKRQYKGNILILNTLQKVKFLKEVFLIFFTQNIILSVSENGRFLFIPILYFKSFFVKSKLILLPAGGDFTGELNELPRILRRAYLKMLQKFEFIGTETPILADKLRVLGIKKVILVPNPRKGVKIDRKEFNLNSINLFFISSIKKTKGIEDISEAVKILNKKNYNCQLQIFGRIKNGYEKRFHSLVQSSTNIYFHGLIDNKVLIKTLAAEADCLLLPTYYKGEGLPGILVEAGLAKVPIIITNYKGAESYFKDEVNALFVKEKNPEDIAEKLEKLFNNEALRKKITDNLFALTEDFKAGKVAKRILYESNLIS